MPSRVSSVQLATEATNLVPTFLPSVIDSWVSPLEDYICLLCVLVLMLAAGGHGVRKGVKLQRRFEGLL